MGRILGNYINDGPRDPNNPTQANTGTTKDPQDPKFIEQQRPVVDWMQQLLELIRRSR